MVADQDPARFTQRLDKWLWHARVVKTRSVAAQLIAQGKFRVNRERVVKPAHMVKCGDVITTVLFGRVRVLRIAGFCERRGPSAQAKTLYVDLTPASEGEADAGDEFGPTPN
jgi:ribosome-associated heat shock protein Hsp15